MNVKYNFYFCLCLIVFILPLSQSSAAMAVTSEELANICEEMESAIVDISLEYEWHNIPPWTVEDSDEVGIDMLVSKDDIRSYSLSAVLSERDPNDPNLPLIERIILEERATVLNKSGDSWDIVTKHCYNGDIYKYLSIGGWPREISNATISRSDRYFMLPPTLTPLGFSVLRFSFSNVTGKTPISTMLRRKEQVHLDDTVKEINGFNTIRVDFLQESTKQVYICVLFSVDHGYTPVRYEFMGGKKHDIVFTVEVDSLEQVAEELWFPSVGFLRTVGSERIDAYMATSQIKVNQDLSDEHFDIEFPAGTEVQDEIRDVKYVVESKDE